MKYMAEKDLIATDIDRKTGKRQYSLIKRFGTRVARFVEFYIGKLAENKDAIDDADELDDGSDLPEAWKQESFGGFREIDGGDEDLPF